MNITLVHENCMLHVNISFYMHVSCNMHGFMLLFMHVTVMVLYVNSMYVTCALHGVTCTLHAAKCNSIFFLLFTIRKCSLA